MIRYCRPADLDQHLHVEYLPILIRTIYFEAQKVFRINRLFVSCHKEASTVFRQNTLSGGGGVGIEWRELTYCYCPKHIVCFLKNTPFAMFLRYFESRNSAEELVRNFVG